MPLPRRSTRRTYNRVSGDTSEASGASLSSSPASLNEPLAPEHTLPDSTGVAGGGRDDTPSPLITQTSADGGNDASSTLTSPHPSPPTAAPSPPPPSCSTSPTPMENPIDVVVLDSAHSKFNITVSPGWTVSKFKSVGSTIHRVPPKSQRLIHMGKLLQDDQTLEYYGITESNKIIHLFPKPNVVVTTSSNSTVSSTGGSGRDDDDDDDDDDEEQRNGATSGGAHVPQIILDAAEAERRSQILILSSSEIFEAQHRVKLLSFLLLIICAMELLTLFTIALGVPQDDGTGGENGYDDDYYVPPGDPTDPASSSGGGGRGSGDGMSVRTWQNSDYADLVISSFGFYVATLGIKATTENTVLLARKYFVCLVVVGIAWNAYYYVLNLRVARKEAIDRRGGGDTSSSDDGDGISESQIRTQAMFAIMLPVFVWCICFLRAWQFQRLIQEAEEEAEERARRLTAGDDADEDDEGDHHGGTRSGSGDGGGRRSSDGPREQGVEVVTGGTDSSSLSSSRVVPYGSGDDLVLQVEGRVIT